MEFSSVRIRFEVIIILYFDNNFEVFNKIKHTHNTNRRFNIFVLETIDYHQPAVITIVHIRINEYGIHVDIFISKIQIKSIRYRKKTRNTIFLSKKKTDG
jgi:hypothetical protein